MINKSSVVIGSYNVKNMFAKEDIRPNSGARPKSEGSMTALGENIRRADADIVALQEVTSKKTLDNFLKKQGLDETYPYVAHVPSHDHRGINVAIISKYPFEKIVSHKDEKFPLVDGSGTTDFSRDFLRVDVDVDGKPGADVSVYTTHSKSRRPSAPGETSADTQRISEATAMRRIAEQEMKPFPNRLFVLTGDFNDNTDDASVQAILNPEKGEKWVDSLAHLPSDKRNTWPANPNKSWGHDPEQFDHIIFPESKSGQMKSSEVVRYTNSLDGSYKWLSSAASDHLMIKAEFDLQG